MRIGKTALIAGVVAGSFAVLSTAALAQAQTPPGWYAGGSLGQSKAKDADCTGFISCDDKDSAWKIFGGYEINRNFAVELGYTNLGEFKASGPGVGTESIESTAWELVGVGQIPIADRFSLYGKLGGYRAETEGRAGALSADESNTGLTFGVGAQYDFTRTVGVRAEWQRYNDVGGGRISETDLDVLSVGVRVKF